MYKFISKEQRGSMCVLFCGNFFFWFPPPIWFKKEEEENENEKKMRRRPFNMIHKGHIFSL